MIIFCLFLLLFYLQVNGIFPHILLTNMRKKMIIVDVKLGEFLQFKSIYTFSV